MESVASQPIGSALEAKPAGASPAAPASAPVPDTARVAVLIVTWNRRDMVEGVLEALTRQSHPIGLLDVIVIDNYSSDGTLDALARRFRPELVVDNLTPHAHEPNFFARPVGERLGNSAGNSAGFGSLTIIRNADNLGGCGGFNTGLAYVELTIRTHADLAGPIAPGGPSTPAPAEFVWLVDDDVDLPPDALRQLLAAMRTDDRIGIVGSRTVDLRDRRTTIETTIYQERSTGVFADEPDADHPRRAEHAAWVATVGGVKGRRAFAGLRDVDIVSACSMLARWRAVERIGFWDHRYFIYCDDADWCLRMAKGGWRIVLNLDAVVYHTPWHHKLTPARLYYAQRNLLWTIRKTTDPSRLRPVLRTRIRTMLRQSREAGLCHRIAHAEVLRRAVDDAIADRGGKVDLGANITTPVGEAAITAASARRAGRPITIACPIHRPIAAEWAAGIRSQVREALGPDHPIRWVELIRNDVPDAHEMPRIEGVDRIVYAPHAKSRLRRQAPLLRSGVDLLVVFDGACDLPLVRSPRWILHVDSAKPGVGVLERGGVRPRLAFLGRWARTAARASRWARSIKPGGPEGKFGGVGAGVGAAG